jgi:hypothetical protein
MKHKKILALTLLGILLYYGCSDKSTEPAGTSGLLMDGGDTIQINAVGPNYIVTTNTNRYCENGVLITETQIDTTYFELTGGQLHLWAIGDCSKIIFESDSVPPPSSIYGTWHTTYDSVPTNDPNCNDTGNMQEILPYITDAAATAVITQNSIEYSSEGNFCIAQFMVDEIAEDEMFLGDTTGEITQLRAQGCNIVSFTMSQSGLDIPVSITYTNAANSQINMRVTMGNCSVTGTMPAYWNEPESCEEDNPFDSPEFMDCIMQYTFETGCLADMMLESDTDSMFTKVDCNTVMAEDIIPGYNMTMQFTYIPEGMVTTTTVGPCSNIDTVNILEGEESNISEDSVFMACVENLPPISQAQAALLKKAFQDVSLPDMRWLKEALYRKQR